MLIEHEAVARFSDLLEHLRYSGSRIYEWEQLENGHIKARLLYQGSKTGWNQVQDRAKSFMFLKITEIRSRTYSNTYRPVRIPEDLVRRCLKCGHVWKQQQHLRLNGNIALRCPKCNSNQTLDTHYIRTKIKITEELSMLTYGKYPNEFSPKTDNEEISGVLVAQEGKARLILGRGFEDFNKGHKILLFNSGGYQTDTQYNEKMSMIGAVSRCPKNSRVFIGGLGVGLILLYLAKTNKTKEVVVCEIDVDTIKLVEPRLRWWFNQKYPDFNWRVIRGNALEEVKKPPPYDWIFMDLWKTSQDIEFMKKAEEAAKTNLTISGKVTCWMMDKYKKREQHLKGSSMADIFIT